MTSNISNSAICTRVISWACALIALIFAFGLARLAFQSPANLRPRCCGWIQVCLDVLRRWALDRTDVVLRQQSGSARTRGHRVQRHYIIVRD